MGLTSDSFTNFKFLSAPKLSNQGKKVAFLVQEVNEEKEDYNSNIWLHDLEKDNTMQLTRSNQDDDFAWAGEDEILFISSRDREEDEEVTDFYRISPTGGEAKKAFSVPHEVKSFQVTDDEIVYKAVVTVGENGEEENEGSCLILDEIPFWGNGEGFTNKRRNHLFARKVSDGNSEVRDITPGPVDVEEYAVRQDKVAFVGAEYQDRAPITNEIYLVSVDGQRENPEKLTDKQGRFWLVEFVDDGKLFVTFTDMEEAGLNENQQLYGYDLNEGSLDLLTPEWKNSFSNRILSDVRLGKGQNSKVSGEEFYFLATSNGVSYLTSSNLSGDVTRLTETRGSVDDFDVESGEKVFIKLTNRRLQELFTLSKDGKEERLTNLNEGAYPESSLASLERFTVERDGEEINSWVLKPPDFDPNSTYPAILEVHGGPKAAYGDVYFHETQYLANNGYVVIFSNPRGSDGKGDEFADIRGAYGKDDYLDLMAVVDRALEKYSFIDQDRLGVTGGSYGGFMTNWIIGHTDRFRAAVSCRSISNWISKFNTTDIGYYFVADQQAGDPWNDHEKLWDQSPLKYADQVATPTLFIHSREDYRCWEGEGLQMFTALKYNDVPAKLCLFEGENHELSRGGKPKNRIKRLEEMLEWFDRYLKS
ncbi:MAG: S9 family peptidase [Candidatus Bipolaricaulota bacterium]